MPVVITSVSPSSGPPAGGTPVTITGTGFTGATVVDFGATPATNVVVVSDTSITADTPVATQDGHVSVSVTSPSGTGTLPNGFLYGGATGPVDVFPAFTPIVPPPVFGLGGGPPPTFPPPTPPPIGAIPPGVLVGPAIAAAAVPPSVAGRPLISYKSGSATVPAAANMVPAFTTVFPKPPIVFSNIFTDGASPVVPPSTATTQNVPVGGWGPPQGPAFPPPSFTLPAAAAAMGELRGGSVLGDGISPVMEEPPHRRKTRRR